MSFEAIRRNCGNTVTWTADADYIAGAVIQLRDGRAAIVTVNVLSGHHVDVAIDGFWEVLKTTSMVVLVGSRLFWDHSANKCHLLHRADRDFFLGTAMEDATTNATTVLVNLNARPQYTSDFLHGGFKSVPIQTAGFVHCTGTGEGVAMNFSATAEAQKTDALGLQGFSPASLPIFEALVCLNDNGDATAADWSIGLASASHNTDADAIAEHILCHLDGNGVNIYFQSKDGSTTVTAADSGVDLTEGTPFLVQFDCRDLEDIQVYVDGVNVLPNSVFKLDAAVGPLYPLVHAEKTSDDTPGNLSVGYIGARGAQV